MKLPRLIPAICIVGALLLHMTSASWAQEKKEPAPSDEKEIILTDDPSTGQAVQGQESPDSLFVHDAEIILSDDAGPHSDQEPEAPANEVQPDTSAPALPPLEQMPELVTFVEADYPADLVKEGVEGTVLMELLISDSGTVDSVTVVVGLQPVLDSSAAAAASQFRFTPAMAGGEPVPVLIQYEYRFSLTEVIDSLATYKNFHGELLERGTKKPLADAMIVLTFSDTLADTTLPVPFSTYLARIGEMEGQYLEENRLVTLTDSLGNFSFFNLPACSISIATPLPGYEQLDEQEVVRHGEVLEVRYYAHRVSYSDYEIVAYGQAEKKEVSRRKLTINEIKRIPGLGGDAVKVIQALPGVSRPTFGSGQIVVRGARTWDSQFYLDGVEIPLLYHFTSAKSTYNSDALEAIDFYPGGWGTRFGGGVGGAIELTGRKPKADRWQGFVDPNLADASFMLEGPVTDKISVLTSARMSLSGFILKWAFDNLPLNLPFTVQPFYWDYLVRTDYAINEDNHCYLTLFGAGDRLELIVPAMNSGTAEISDAADRVDVSIKFFMFLAGWDMTITPKLQNSLRYAFTYANSFTSVFGLTEWTEKPLVNHFRDQLTYTHSPRLKVNVGADISLIDENLDLVIPNQYGIPERDNLRHWLFGVVGGYANLEIKPFEELLIIPGLRYDFYPELDYQGAMIPEFWDYHFDSFDNTTRFAGEPSARLTTRWEFVPNHTAKGAIGNYSQTPQPVGQVIHPTWGVPTMPATKAAHYVLGYEWQITDLVSLDLQGYLNRQWNIPRIQQSEEISAQEEGGALWLPDAKGRMKGLELMLRHDQGERFFGWLAYTLSKAERWDPVDRTWELFDEDETHYIQLLGSFRLNRNWDAGFRLRYVTGKPTTPVDSVTYMENFAMFRPHYGKTNSERVEPFFQLDLRVDKKIIFPRAMLAFYLDLQNVSWFFYKSPEFYIYNYDYTDRTTVSNFPLPAFGIRLEF